MITLSKNRKVLYGAVLTAFGVIMTTTLDNAIGMVFIGAGAIYFIFGMQDMKKEKDTKK